MSARATKPLTALGRIQDLAGKAKAASWNDHMPNRQAQIQSILQEIYDLALASRSGDELPEPRDHESAI